jgi:hypothetical protein
VWSIFARGCSSGSSVIVSSGVTVLGLVEDTPENHPQVDVAFRPDGVQEGKPLRTVEAVLYPIDNMRFSSTALAVFSFP